MRWKLSSWPLRAHSEHRDKAHDTARRCKMLQRVAADDVTDLENLSIDQLQTFGGRIGDEAGNEISGTCIPAGIQHEQKQDQNQRTELNEKVQTQVASVLELAPIPVRDAARPDDE